VECLDNLVVLDESILLDGADGDRESSRRVHSIRLDIDSYIIVWVGRRGGGKTTSMTWMAAVCIALWNMRLISNYNIDFMLRRHRPDGKTYLQHIKAEPLDFYKLMTLDKEYKNCLILIDEAPEIISYMASQSWKNRLFEAFVRQIRKNSNSLFLGTQDFELIDKACRWQTDVIVECKDLARAMGDNSNLSRGENIEWKWLDNNGMWTGKSTREREWMGMRPYVKRQSLTPCVLWGDKTCGTKPVFDTNFVIDILESLRKVDIRMTKIRIGDEQKLLVPDGILETSLQIVEIGKTQGKMKMTEFYNAIGDIDQNMKSAIGKMLSKAGIRRYAGGWFDFSEFDMEKFKL
jgi:hypothetical protein